MNDFKIVSKDILLCITPGKTMGGGGGGVGVKARNIVGILDPYFLDQHFSR